MVDGAGGYCLTGQEAELELLAPFAEPESSFQLEDALDGAFAGARDLRQLSEGSFFGSVFLEQRRDSLGPSVARQWKMNRVGLHNLKMVQQDRDEMRMRRAAYVECVQLDNPKNEFAKQR